MWQTTCRLLPLPALKGYVAPSVLTYLAHLSAADERGGVEPRAMIGRLPLAKYVICTYVLPKLDKVDRRCGDYNVYDI